MLTARRETWGGLDCIVVDAQGSRPTWLAVLMHGYGATGEDLVPLAAELVACEPSLADEVRFVFPAAPIEPPEMADYGGRAWWLLDVGALQLAILQKRFRDRTQEMPPELTSASARVTALVNELTADLQIPLEHVILGGFSQGSMLATDVALHLPSAPGGLIVWSGTLLCEPEWRRCAPQRRGLPVWQSHGRKDPILPFEAAEWLRELLESSGLAVEFSAFDGPHTIPGSALTGSASFLTRLIRS